MSYLEQFHYQITGNPEGHKLVFLHGLMGAGQNWRPVAKTFEDRFQILTFDQRGHGRSFKPAQGYHPRDFANDLKQILAELRWDKIALVGHSMGGRNSLEFAGHYPDQVAALVLEDIGPEANSGAISRIERLLEAVPTPFSSREEARGFFAREYASRIAWYPQPEVISRFFQTNIEEKPDGTYDWRFVKQGIFESMRTGRNEDRWDMLRNLRMPVLMIRGANSGDLPAETFARMRAVLPHASAVEIPEAGHWVHFDQPDAFIAALNAFFRTVFGSNL